MSLEKFRWASEMMSASRDWVWARMFLVGFVTITWDSVDAISPAVVECTAIATRILYHEC